MTGTLTTQAVRPDETWAPMLQRLLAAGSVLLSSTPRISDEGATPRDVVMGAVDEDTRRVFADATEDWELASTLLEVLAQSVRLEPGGGRLWLLLTALLGEFPVPAQVQQGRRALELAGPGGAAYELLDRLLPRGARASQVERQMDVVTDRPVVLVHFCANDELMTGVQRVVRHTMPHWVRDHEVVLAAWTADGAGTCALSETQEQRVLSWHAPRTVADKVEQQSRLVVPWRVPVILPEVPFPEHSARLVALAHESGSPLRLVGYDCIPVASADLVFEQEHEKFMDYLNIVKYADRVAGISDAATEEFVGFTEMVKGQGLGRATLISCPLPSRQDVGDTDSSGRLVEADDGRPAKRDRNALPTIVCVGSIDRRKNQETVLEVAERLWAKGHRFALRFIGSGGTMPPTFGRRFDKLSREGFPVTIERSVSDRVIRNAILEARFTVFISLHEGFGIPPLESLTLGVPVITSDRGSLAEVVEGDGAIKVDPTDVDAVTTAIEKLLTDDELLNSLAKTARDRVRTTWADYARDLWEALVEPAVVIA